MRIFNKALFVLIFVVVIPERLPAPIHEEATVTPKPARVSPPKPKVTETTKPKAPAILFAGNWKGTAAGEMHAPLASPNYSDNYNIQVSTDEKTVSWTASKWLGAHFQAPAQRKGRTLSWSYEKHDTAGKSLINSSLQVNSDGTATFHETDQIDNGLFKGSGYSVTGKLFRQ